MKPGIDTQLHFARIDGEGWYWGVLPMIYTEHEGAPVLIPALFLHDGASIPKVFQSMFSKTGKYLFAAVIHDWMYKSDCTQKMTRKDADILFLHYMKSYGVGWFTRYAIFQAVRVGGWGSWNKKKATYYTEP
jgi:hypothetical protein